MFYDPRETPQPEPLGHNPINALVAPRPIGWIGSLSGDGAPNLAPFSYFNLVSADPPVVAFAPHEKTAAGGPKDTLANVRNVPEFTASIVSEALAAPMNESSRVLPHGASEFAVAGLTPAASRVVAPPYVREALAALECRVFDIVELPSRPTGRRSHLVIGEVVGIHIDDRLIVDGRIDSLALAQLARLGYHDYTVVREVIEIPRPD
ncbi:MAG: flavin reductase family protein [Pseudomonadales bacterium]|nr:flavin reductase family protein [Pseudomonadales bacterium]NIX06748.1 flavin reductase family protein [Pseudomonadales bacterium]